MSAAEFSGVGGSGLIATTNVEKFTATQFASGENRAEILARLNASGAEEVLVFPTRERQA